MRVVLLDEISLPPDGISHGVTNPTAPQLQPAPRSDDDVCFICLGSDGELCVACACPSRFVHRRCLSRWGWSHCGQSGTQHSPRVRVHFVTQKTRSKPPSARIFSRWQLQKAGQAEEHLCRFCSHALPDWRPSLKPDGLEPAPLPVMTVSFNNQAHHIPVQGGPDGLDIFKAKASLWRAPAALLRVLRVCALMEGPCWDWPHLELTA